MLQHFTPILDPGTKLLSLATDFDNIPFEYRLIFYKVGIIFSTYQRMRVKWKS